MNRSLALVGVVGLTGILGLISVPVVMYADMHQAERAAAESLVTLSAAQRAFRRSGGQGGYATELASLATPCSGTSQPSLVWNPNRLPEGYLLQLRAADRSIRAGSDCHGRPTATDFYAAAAPRRALSGRHAMATTSRGRIYVFFDGIAPLEADMDPRGLAVPLDVLDTFKIP